MTAAVGGVARNSTVVTALNLVVLVCGLALYTAIVSLFGASSSTDAFFLALAIPSLFLSPALAAVSTALIPALSDCRENRPERVAPLLGSALTVSVGLAVVSAVVIGGLTPTVLSLAGSEVTPEAHSLIPVHVVALLPMVVFQTAAAVLGAASNTAGCFWLPALAAVVRQLVTLALVYALHGRAGIVALPVAFSIGAAAQLTTLVWFRRFARVPLRFARRVDPELRRILRVAYPLLLGTAAIQVGLFVARVIASSLGPGAVTAFDYASRITIAVMEVVSTGVVLVSLSDWSMVAARGDQNRLGQRVTHTIALVIFAIAPVVLCLYVTREAVVALWLHTASLGAQFRAVIASTLGYMVIGLPFDMVGRMMVQLLVVRRLAWTLALIAGARVLTMVALSLVLGRSFGVAGLGMADTAGLVVTVVFFSLVLRRELGSVLASIPRAVLRTGTATVGAWVCMRLAMSIVGGQSSIVVVFVLSAVGILSFLVVARLVRAPELNVLRALAFGATSPKVG